MEKKEHFKLYKNGKKWCVAAITVVGITAGFNLVNTPNVKADQVLSSNQPTQVVLPKDNVVTDEKQEITPVDQSKLTDNGNGNVASYNQNDQLQSYTANSIVYQPNATSVQSIPENNISTININGDFSGISKDNPKNINTQINFNNGQSVNAWGTIKYQGNSSLSLPKKGYRLKLYEDEGMTKKLKLEIPGSGFKTNAFNLKSNFNDPNKGNNVVNAEIFKQITTSRLDLKDSIVKRMPNYGQIAGIPVSLTINGINMGMYTLNTYHQDKLFKMNDKKTTDIAITGEGYDPVTGFQQPVTMDNFINDNAFSNVSPANISQATVDRFNELYQVANASEDNYLKLEQQYIDLPSAIDYLVFSFAINNIDGLRKNIFYLSKDGSKWTLMPYDLDTSWGTLWDGTSTDQTADFNQRLIDSQNQLLINIFNHHKQEVIDRYKELRQNVLSTANVLTLFNQWFDSIGEKNYQANDQIWNQYNMDGLFTHRAYLPKQELFNQINSRLKAVDKSWGITIPDETITLSETKNVTRTIQLNLPDGTKRNDKQLVTFRRKSQYNTATNQLTINDEWSANNPVFTEYVLPTFQGYTGMVNDQPVNNIQSLKVTANMNSSIINVNYIDDSFDKNNAVNNLAWLDHVQLSNNELHITGWHVNSQVANYPYHYIIVFDKTNSKELGRIRVTNPIYRPDVKKAHNLYKAEYSGFDVTVPLNFSNLTDELTIISRFSNEINGEGNYVEYWNPSIKLDQSNNANLDDFEISANNTLHVSGWHATNQAINKPYHFVILFDQTTGHEIGRQRVLNGVRTDVQKVLPNINNSLLSSFSADFSLDNLNLSHNLQLISRYSDNLGGEGSYIDYWFNPVKLMPSQQQNIGHLDTINISDGQLQVSGWHATNMLRLEKNHYLILFDRTTNTQVMQKKIGNIERPDVAQIYKNIDNAVWSGFNVNLGKVSLLPEHKYSLVSRYSTINTGNGDRGIYTDYWYDLPENNQQAFNIDNLQLTNKGLHLTGWMASDYSVIAPHAYIIVLSNGHEIGRQQVKLTDRFDVANVVSNIYNSQQSGFDVTINVDPAQISNNLQLLFRFTGSQDGNSDYYDQLSQEYPINAGYFDSISVNNKKVFATGWHVDDRAINKNSQYLILLKDGQEIARTQLEAARQNLVREDVGHLYPSIYNSYNAGFNGEILAPVDLTNSHIQVIHRYTASKDGNSDYVDFYSPIIKIK